MIWLSLYRALLHPALQAAMRVVALWSPKVRRGLEGRRRWREQIAGLPRRGPRVHVHAASVGEFEQAKPIIERLRGELGECTITATFFSPSGYEQQGKYSHLDGVCYLPFDRPGEMRDFYDRIAPDLVLIIRYDLWPELLVEAHRRAVPVVLVCGVLRSGSARLRPVLRGFFRWLYGMLAEIHAVSSEDADAFARLGIAVPVVVDGDTRYDRVIQRASAQADLPWFDESLAAGRLTLVAGSTWPQDEEILTEASAIPDLFPVIVPHEPTAPHVAALRERFPGAVTVTEIERGELRSAPPAVIVDRTGILAALYRVASIAYVGGGFGQGVHSVLEPAAYCVPVIAGPRIGRSRDATALGDAGCLLMIDGRDALRRTLADLVADEGRRREIGQSGCRFVRERLGATERIVSALSRLRTGG
jgi:3-deoxy-D-manno-octulosonic-acid transferase